MMGHKIGLAGDWHGNNTWARHAIYTFHKRGITDVFQLGDFGLGWPTNGTRMLKETHDACVRFNVNLYIVPGNHENWDWINDLGIDNITKVVRPYERVYVLGRGFRAELPHDRTVVALGGAPSIDKDSRTEGVDWWSAEMITVQDADAVAAEGHADIMLTHDSPSDTTDAVSSIIQHNPQGWPKSATNYAAEGRGMIDRAVRGVRPKVLAHGHFHVDDEKVVGDTKVLSLNMDRSYRNLIELDLETLEHEWLDIELEIPK